jgi:hypothetical protein
LWLRDAIHIRTSVEEKIRDGGTPAMLEVHEQQQTPRLQIPHLEGLPPQARSTMPRESQGTNRKLEEGTSQVKSQAAGKPIQVPARRQSAKHDCT